MPDFSVTLISRKMRSARLVPAMSFAFLPAGLKRPPRRGEQQAWSDSRGTEVVLDRAERRPCREYRPYETERQADFPAEKFTDEK